MLFVGVRLQSEIGVANLILWADRFEKQRRLVMTAGMIACHGRVQREGEVIHVVTDHLEDPSALLRSVGDLDSPFPLRHGNGEWRHPSGRPRSARWARRRAGGRPVRDIYIPDLRLGSGTKVLTHDFR